MRKIPREQQSLRILQVYTVYRLVLGLILPASHLLSSDATRLGSTNAGLFLGVCAALLLYGTITALLTRRLPDRALREKPLLALLLADTIAVTLLTYASGGMVSGLGLLLLVCAAAGGILIRGRVTYLLPAVGSLAVLYAEVYIALTADNPPRQYVQAGLLGALLFAATAYLQTLSERMQRSDELAEQQASSIHDLEQLNYRIVQRMRTGMVLLDEALRPVTWNGSAGELLGFPPDDTTRPLPAPIAEAVRHWQKTGGVPDTLRLRRSGPELRLFIDWLHPDDRSHILVFLNDNSAFLQRVRQMKLASLGELTAGIAHEIRNPLGALSHAGQLLKESTAIAGDDRKLLRMILGNSERINLIIEDVLSLSRQKEQAPEVITLRSWLTQYLEEYRRSHAPDADIQLRISPAECRVRFIPSQLRQVLDNLVENGLRSSRKKTGRATLRLTGGYRSGSLREQAFLNVIDDGPGIPESEQERLFEPFHTTERDGTGLGLYISRQLCEANHARLIYRRTRRGESCFSLYFHPPERDIN